MRVKFSKRIFAIIAIHLLLLLSFLYFDMYPQMKQCQAMDIRKKNIRKVLQMENKLLSTAQPKKSFRYTPAPLIFMDVMKNFIQVLHKNSLSLLVLQPLTTKKLGGVTMWSFKVGISGQSNHFLQFLIDLHQSPLLYEIKKLSLSREAQDSLNIEMQISVANFQEASDRTHRLKHFQINETEGLSDVSWQQIKRVGYLQDEHSIWGILMLPNGKAVDVQVGSYIGKEKGQVVQISKEKIVFMLGKNRLNIPEAFQF